MKTNSFHHCRPRTNDQKTEGSRGEGAWGLGNYRTGGSCLWGRPLTLTGSAWRTRDFLLLFCFLSCSTWQVQEERKGVIKGQVESLNLEQGGT